MKRTKKLSIFSIVLFSLILSLIFPINVLADDATPPPVETPEVLPPTEAPVVTEEPVAVEVTPIVPVATEAPITEEVPGTEVPVTEAILPTNVPVTETPAAEETGEIDLAEIVAAADENEVILADTSGEPLTLASQAASALLTSGDPFFWDGNSWEGYTIDGTGCPANVNCHQSNTPLQAAVSNAPTGSIIYVAGGNKANNPIDYGEDVTINTADLSFRGYSTINVSSGPYALPTLTTGYATTKSITLNAVFGTTSGVFASTVNVNPNGTIQDGVDLVAVGGTVSVAPGIYKENVSISAAKSGITISGEPGADTVAGAAWNAPVLDGNNTGIGVNVYADDVTLMGLFIQDYAVGIQLNASGNATFTGENNTIQNNGIGVYNANSVPGVILHYNIFTNNGYAIRNVVSGGSQYIEAQNNYWGCAPGPVVEHTYIDNNDVSHTDYYQWTPGGPHDVNGDDIWDELLPNFDPAQSDCEVLVGDNEQRWNHNPEGWSPYKIKLSPIETTMEGCPTGYTGTYPNCVAPLPDAQDDTDTTNEDIPIITNVLTNDSLGVEPTTITSNTQGTNGAVSCTDTQCTYTPNLGFSGTDTYTYTITDGNGKTDTATVTITVNPVNYVPLAVDDTNSTIEDTSVDGSVADNDTPSGDGGNTWTKLTDPGHGTVTFNPDATYTYTPNPNWSGIDSFTYQLCDVDSDCSTATVSIVVMPSDDLPVANDDTNSTNEETPVNGSVAGNDNPSGDGGNIWSQVSNPSNGNVVFNADGTYTYTPNANWSGTDSFDYELCDVDEDCSTATVTITVAPVDDLPVANDDTNTTSEDTPVAGSVAGNDIPSGDGGNTWSQLTGPGNGTLTFNPDGTYTYTPNLNWNGTDSFDYRLCDVDDDCDSATVTITVGAVNNVPVAANDTNSTNEDTSVDGNVTGNDIPSGDGGNAWSKLTDPANGSVTFNENGSYTYTPHANWNGTDSFTYQLCDIDGDCSTATVTITVAAADDLPVANDDTNSTNEDTPVGGSVAGNDALSGDGGNTWSQASSPSNGSVVFNTDGTYTYTPDLNWSGTDSFDYQLCDADEDCSTATVTIIVGAIDDAPVATNDTNSTNEDTPVDGSVADNDTLSGDGGNAWSKLTDPSNGTVTFNPDGTYTYTPSPNWNGTDSFTYQLCDVDGDCDPALVTITVVAVDDAPVAVDDTNSTDEDSSVSGSVAGNDILSGDGGNIWSQASDPSYGTVTLNPDGTYTYTPDANWSGTDSFDYVLCDMDEDCSTATVTIRVGNLPDALDDKNTTSGGTPVTTNVLTNDDLGAGPTEITSHTQGTNGTVTCTATQCTYTPNAGFSGTDTYTYTITDSNSNTDTAIVTITIVMQLVPGCMDPTALNYNPLATVSNGTCLYSTPRNAPRVPSVSFTGIIPTTGGEVHAIAAGIAHTCAITPQGGVQCWGNNDFGQLGDGTNIDSNVPVDVVGIEGGITIVAGGNHTCVLSGGSVWCWGQNSQGQLGDGTRIDRNVPVNVLSSVVDITAGLDYTCAIMTYGQVKCWGNNDQGQLADGTKTDRTIPTLASLISGISNVDAGQNKSCGLTSAGLLRCMDNGAAQDIGGIVPVTGGSPEGSLDVAVNRFGSLVMALIEDGVPVAFQAGRFREINNVNHAIDVDSGLGHVCTLINNGTVQCWGSNVYGQLGRNSMSSSSDPLPVLNISGAWQLAVGKNHACVLITSNNPGTNDIQCWGLNKDGQLGNGTNENSSVPVFVK